MSDTDRSGPTRNAGTPKTRQRRGKEAAPSAEAIDHVARQAEVPLTESEGQQAGDGAIPAIGSAAPGPVAPQIEASRDDASLGPSEPAVVAEEPVPAASIQTMDDASLSLNERASPPVRPSPTAKRLALAALALSILLPAALYLYLADSGVFDTGRLRALESSVATLRAAPPPKAEVSRADLDTLGARLDRLEKMVATLGQAAAAPSGTETPASSDMAAAARDAKEALSQAKNAAQAAAVAQGIAGRIPPLEAKIADLEKRLAATEQSQSANAKAGSNAASMLVLSRAISTDIKTGQPYAGELDTLARLGADPAQVEALRPFADKGAPSSATLASEFEAELAAARAKVEAERQPTGLWDKITSLLGKLVRVRRVGGVEPGTPAATVEVALGRGDVAAALDAWNGLPVFEKTATPASGGRIKALAGAEAAARRISTDALEAIRRAGSTKSDG